MADKNEWQDIGKFMDEQDKRRLESIPDKRPTKTIWAQSGVWEAIRGGN
jgi:hypothetical protein